MSRDAPTASRAGYQRIGFLLGPTVAVLIAVFFRPESLPPEATFVAAVGALMAIWWATEAIPVAVTAFMPMVLLPILGVGSVSENAAPYSHPIIYLFFGGFVMALAIERCGLHRRIALSVFAVVGTNARSLVGGFMVAAALLSMWISNTSTTLMLLPIAISVVKVIGDSMPGLDDRDRSHFNFALLLGLAYGATLGGVATLVGTPPNAFMAGFMIDTYDMEIDFARWMLVGVPVTLVMLPLAWFLLTRVIYRVDFVASAEVTEHISNARTKLGPMTGDEKRTGWLFLFLVAGWLLRKPIANLPFLGDITDTTIAMAAAVAAFLIPSERRNEALMRWSDLSKLPWGVLILFGGGLALAAAISSSGLALWIGQQLAPLGVLNLALLVVAATAMVIFLTELTSNLATTATFLPVIAAIAVETGQDPLIFVIPVTLAASCAFMLPVATPPNAIVFSSGQVSIPEMMRAGILLNIISVAFLSLLALTLAPAVF